MDPTVPIELEVNGTPVRRRVEPRLCLADFLRYDLELTGTHVGCEHGVCGACTVRVDGVLVRVLVDRASARARGRSETA